MLLFSVRVRVSVRRCCRFSGLYAFHSSGDVAVGMRRPTIAVMSCKAPASSTHALLQYVGHRVHHIRSKSTSENDTGGWGQTRSRTPSALLIVRLLTERYYRALSRWKYYALCSQSLSLCFVVSATASILHCLRDNNLSSYYFWIKEKRVLERLLLGWTEKFDNQGSHHKAIRCCLVERIPTVLRLMCHDCQ